MGLNQISNEQEINVKIEAYKRGHYSVLDLFDKQIEALEILNDSETDDLVYGGAAGGGKSWLGDEWLLWSCLAYPETRWFIGRDNKQQIRNSTVVTFRKVCKKHNIPLSWWKYDNQTVKITFANGSIIDGLELHYMPSDPDFDNLGSTEYTGGWIEEAGGIHEKAKEVLSVRIGRHNNDRYNIRGKMLITANPSKNWLYTEYYKPFKDSTLDASKKFIQSKITDNSKRESGYLEKLQNLKGAVRDRLLDGNWDYDNDPLALIDYDAIIDSFDNSHLTPNGKKYITVDAALEGSDELTVMYWDDRILEDYKVFAKSSGKEMENYVREMKTKHGVPNSNIAIDADGVGGYLSSYIVGAKDFKNGSAPLEERDANGKPFKPNYQNLKTQCEYKAAKAINERKYWLKAVKTQTEKDLFIQEMQWIKKYDIDNDKVLKTMPKKLIKQNISRSPDRWDGLKMRELFDLTQKRGFSMS